MNGIKQFGRLTIFVAEPLAMWLGEVTIRHRHLSKTELQILLIGILADFSWSILFESTTGSGVLSVLLFPKLGSP